MKQPNTTIPFVSKTLKLKGKMCATLLYSFCFKQLLLDKQQLSTHLLTHSYSTNGRPSHFVSDSQQFRLKLRPGRPEVQFPEWPWDFNLQKISRLPLGPSQPPIQWTSGIKELAGEFENSPTSSAEVKNEWSYTSP